MCALVYAASGDSLLHANVDQDGNEPRIHIYIGALGDYIDSLIGTAQYRCNNYFGKAPSSWMRGSIIYIIGGMEVCSCIWDR